MKDTQELNSITEQVREKFNPNWRKYLKMHLEILGKANMEKLTKPRRKFRSRR